MSEQSITHTKTVKIGGKDNPKKKKETTITVAAHERKVNGKTIKVPAYTYTKG